MQAGGRRFDPGHLHHIADLASWIFDNCIVRGSHRSTPKQQGCGGGRQFSVISFVFKLLKGVWWMTWHEEATKDVVSCDKPRGAANRL